MIGTAKLQPAFLYDIPRRQRSTGRAFGSDCLTRRWRRPWWRAWPLAWHPELLRRFFRHSTLGLSRLNSTRPDRGNLRVDPASHELIVHGRRESQWSGSLLRAVPRRERTTATQDANGATVAAAPFTYSTW